MNPLGRYAKALMAGLTAGYGSYQVAAADAVITTDEWVQVALTVIIAIGVVWGVPNATVTPPPSKEVGPPQT